MCIVLFLFLLFFFLNLGQTDCMIMLNVGIESETEITGELNSGDLKNMTSKLGNCQPLDVHSGKGVSCLQFRFYI